MGNITAIACLPKRLLAALLVAIMFSPLVTFAQPNVRKVAIITSNTEGIYLEVTNSIVQTITDSAANNIMLSVIDSENTTETERLSGLISTHDLVVTIGLSASSTINAIKERPPLLAVLIPLQTAQSLLQSSPPNTTRPSPRASAIVLDQPLERQLRLTKIITKGSKSVGILLSPSSGLSKEKITHLSKHFNLAIYTETVNPGDNFIRELGYVLDKADILLAIPDPSIFNRQTAGSILQSAYRHRVPVIGFSQSHVKAGALAAVFSSPEQIGRHTGESILEYFANDEEEFPAIQVPRYFSVAFNRQVERSLGLTMPKESDVEREMQSPEGMTP